jgi:predicted HTH domain antitoxin
MLMQELKLKLPLEVSPDEVKLLLAIKLYEVGKLSIGQAAKVAGYSKRAFMEILGHYQVPIFIYTPDNLQQEVSLFVSFGNESSIY